MSERLIRESDVLENIDEWLESVGYATIGKGLSYYAELKGCIEEAPTVDAEPVVRAHWKPEPHFYEKGMGNKYFVCSRCNTCLPVPVEYPGKQFDFCPRCGARMDGKENENARKS